jgi:putative molybdopterin biosynthesis protein
MIKRNLYLSNISIEQAHEKYFSALDGCLSPKFEEIPVEKSLDRITAKDVHAHYNSPLFNCAAMDGIAVIAASTEKARESNPLVLKEGKDFIHINTGDRVFHPFDAVIMAEDIIQLNDDEKTATILHSASQNQHIRPVGEDFAKGEMIVCARHKIRPIDIGVLISAGISSIEVYAKPKAAVFPTGSEMIEAGIAPQNGEIIESNSHMFSALLSQEGASAVRFPSIPDNFELLKETIEKAAQDFDMIIVNAGSSAGTEDFVVQALRGIGEVIVHGVAMKPGKPVILAKVNNKPVIGTPGYPVSAYLSFKTFVSPVLAKLTGQKTIFAQTVEAVLSKRIVSSLKHREYVRVKIDRVDGKLTATPLARGAGAAMSLVKADGFCVIEQNSEGIEAGETVRIERLLQNFSYCKSNH